MRRVVHQHHWLTCIANKSSFVSTPVYVQYMTGLCGRGHMTASTTNAMSSSHGSNMLRNTRFLRMDFANQWSSLTVSRPSPQPLHRLSHPANHACSSMVPRWPLLEGRGQLRHLQPYWMFVRRQDTIKQCLGKAVVRYHLPLCGCSPHRRSACRRGTADCLSSRLPNCLSTTPSISSSQPCKPYN
jgi:hypothetical protein